MNTYRNPKEEQRVFMFLDMQDSTPAAEKMGHLTFSRYIQDCFYDLSDIVLDHGGSIYQFVGDEAVITWNVSKKFNFAKCIDLYFSYNNHLNKKTVITSKPMAQARFLNVPYIVERFPQLWLGITKKKLLTMEMC